MKVVQQKVQLLIGNTNLWNTPQSQSWHDMFMRGVYEKAVTNFQSKLQQVREPCKKMSSFVVEIPDDVLQHSIKVWFAV